MRRLLARLHAPARPGGDLGAVPPSWRGFIPRQLPRTSARLRWLLTGLGCAYAAAVLALALFPTPSASTVDVGLPPAHDRVLVHTDGSEHTRDIMRWIFLGVRSELSACLGRGQAVQVLARFEDGRLRTDSVRHPCVHRAVENVRVPSALSGLHQVTLTKVWLKPSAKRDVENH